MPRRSDGGLHDGHREGKDQGQGHGGDHGQGHVSNAFWSQEVQPEQQGQLDYQKGHQPRENLTWKMMS